MEVIGRKKRGMAVGYILCLAVLVVCFVITLILFTGNPALANPLYLIMVILEFIAIIVVVVTIVIYIKAPNEPIKYDHIGAIYINEQKINLVDIMDVSYKQNRNRYGTFEHGTITVQTRGQTYKANYVDECESVCKLITKLVYDSQNKQEQ